MLLDKQDQQYQSLVGLIWEKITKGVEILFLGGAFILLLHLIVSLAALGKLFPAPSWLWTEIKVIVYPYSILLWFRLLTTFTGYKLRFSSIEKYLAIGACSFIALGLVLNMHAWWSDGAFPLLCLTYAAQFVLDAHLPPQKKRRISPSSRLRSKRKQAVHKGQAPVSKQNGMEFREHHKQVEQPVFQDLLPQVIICYSPADERFAKRIRLHLGSKVQQKKISLWDASQILPGALWQEERAQALQTAAIAILLISPDFLGCTVAQYELLQLLHRACMRETLLLRVHISHCDFEGKGLEKFSPVNPPDKPLAKLSYPDRDQVYTNLVKGVCQYLRIST